MIWTNILYNHIWLFYVFNTVLEFVYKDNRLYHKLKQRNTASPAKGKVHKHKYWSPSLTARQRIGDSIEITFTTLPVLTSQMWHVESIDAENKYLVSSINKLTKTIKGNELYPAGKQHQYGP